MIVGPCRRWRSGECGAKRPLRVTCRTWWGAPRSAVPAAVRDHELEASWTVFAGEGSMWHDTRVEALESIAREGILRGQRSHVHLAETRESQVGKRANVSVLLEVSPSKLRMAGLAVYKSPNGVLLCRRVPPACIVDLHPLTKRARQSAAALRVAFGLPA